MKIQTNVKAGLELTVKTSSSVKVDSTSTVDISIKI
jgi:hypothetical protein